MRSPVTVALLDSGIRCDQRPRLGDVVDAWKGESPTFDDLTGHGTACAVLIRRMAPAARILNVKVFDASAVTSPQRLLDGLGWCVEQGVDVVNVSVALPQAGLYHDFVDLCRRAREKNVVVIAAADNLGRPSLPAYLNTVLGVGSASVDDECCFYLPDKPIQFYARADADESSRDYLSAGPQQGSSFATARISGLAARLVAQAGESDGLAVEQELARMAIPFDASRVATPNEDVDLEAIAAPAGFRSRLSDRVDSFGRAVLFGSALDAKLFADQRHRLRVPLTGVVTAPTRSPLLPADAAPRVSEDGVLSALEGAETLILGHVDSRELDLPSLVRRARARGRNVFSLRPRGSLPADLLDAGDAAEGTGWLGWPEVDESALAAVLASLPRTHIPKSQVPVVAVVHLGTQRIGRLAIELTVRDALVRAGFAVAQIGSVPYAELFGCDFSHWSGCVSATLPAGQHVALGKLMVETLNHSTSAASLILAGCDQPPCPPSLVTSDFLSAYSMPTLCFLFGIQPRAAVVVVDELTDRVFLRRNVEGLSALLGCDVLCLLHDSPWQAYAAALGKTLPSASDLRPCQCQTFGDLVQAPVLCREAPDTGERLASITGRYFRPMGEIHMSNGRRPDSDPEPSQNPVPKIRPEAGVPDANALAAARQIAERLAGGAMPGADALQAARQLAARLRAEAAASGGAAGSSTAGSSMAGVVAPPSASAVDPLQAARQLAQLIRQGAAKERFSWARLGFLLPFLRRRSATAMAIAGLTLVASAITVPAPLVLKRIIDVDLPRGQSAPVLAWAGVLLGLYVAGLVAKLLLSYVSSTLNSTLLLDLKKAIFERVLTLPMSFFTENQSSYLAARLNEIDRVGAMFSMTFISLVLGGLTFLFSAALLVVLDWRLFAIVAAFVPLQYVVLSRLTGGIQRISSSILERNAQVSRSMQEVFAGMSTVKAYAAERREASKLEAPLSALVKSSFLQGFALRFSGDLIGFLGQLTSLGLLVGSMVLILRGQLTIGTYVAAIGLVDRMFSPLQALAAAGLVAQPVVAAINRVAEYFETIGEDEAPQRVHGPSRLSGKIEFRDVSFSYPGKERLLSHVSFTVRAGERVAIVGPNGSGKTTLMKLLLQLHLPENGAVLVDDVDLSTYRLDSLRRRIGFVSQDVFLFNDTILANLTYGGATGDPAELRALVEQCCPFLKDLPEGLSTRVGEAGLALSGGQRQAVSIVRALLKSPDVLVFDEGSTHLDDLARDTLKTIIRERCAGKTCILISHDADIIATADRAIVMQEGTVVERERSRA